LTLRKNVIEDFAITPIRIFVITPACHLVPEKGMASQNERETKDRITK